MKLTDIILNEGINDNIGKISLTYSNYGRPYKMKVDDRRISFEEMEDLIKGLTGLELPERALYTDTKILNILDALKAKGIDADSWEMDVD